MKWKRDANSRWSLIILDKGNWNLTNLLLLLPIEQAERVPSNVPSSVGSVNAKHTVTDSRPIQGARTPQDTVIVPDADWKKRRRPVGREPPSVLQQGATRGRVRPRKDAAYNEGGMTAWKAPEATQAKRGSGGICSSDHRWSTTPQQRKQRTGGIQTRKMTVGQDAQFPQPEDA